MPPAKPHPPLADANAHDARPSVLVTGGTGFLGSHLVRRLLAEGRTVTVVSRKERPELCGRGIRVVVGSLHDPAVCEAAVQGAGTIFHVAARVNMWGRYADFYRDNVSATETLLAAARRAGVQRFVYTSTPSVVYNGRNIANGDESLPLTENCPSPYPLTKAIAERKVLEASGAKLRTTVLRPHLMFGAGDPHIVPKVLARARAGRLRIVGSGENHVDMVHVENVVDAHLLAERALCDADAPGPAVGRVYFITNGEPIGLWDWVNRLLLALGEAPVTRRIPLCLAKASGLCCEFVWWLLPFRGDPPLTRFIATELAKDHWFSIAAARRDLGYQPRIGMAQGMADLVEFLKKEKIAVREK